MLPLRLRPIDVTNVHSSDLPEIEVIRSALSEKQTHEIIKSQSPSGTLNAHKFNLGYLDTQ